MFFENVPLLPIPSISHESVGGELEIKGWASTTKQEPQKTMDLVAQGPVRLIIDGIYFWKEWSGPWTPCAIAEPLGLCLGNPGSLQAAVLEHLGPF